MIMCKNPKSQTIYYVIYGFLNLPGGADISPTGRKSIFEVAQRMTRSFYDAMCGPCVQQWRSSDNWRGGCGTGSERFEVAAQVVTFSIGSGEPASVVLRATAVVWLHGIPAQQVFDYLRDGYRRGEWDSLAKGSPTIEEGYYPTGQLRGNAVYILRTIVSLECWYLPSFSNL
jgi:homeobox-leucine zipper protein